MVADSTHGKQAKRNRLGSRQYLVPHGGLATYIVILREQKHGRVFKGSADVNQDRAVDGDDVIHFFERWDTGC